MLMTNQHVLLSCMECRIIVFFAMEDTFDMASPNYTSIACFM
jgi:hypothetical protein